MNQTEERKREHVQICLDEDVSAHHNYLDDVNLVHNALPEINENEIDLSTEIFGKILGAPIVISAITGGYNEGKKINENLAAAAEKFKLAMGVGSQRSALENSKLKDTYNVINDYDIPVKIANIGASQIVLWDKKKILENTEKIVKMINADVLAIHLNFLQEAVQPEGETHAKRNPHRTSHPLRRQKKPPGRRRRHLDDVDRLVRLHGDRRLHRTEIQGHAVVAVLPRHQERGRLGIPRAGRRHGCTARH